MSPASYQTAPPRDACQSDDNPTIRPSRAGNGTRTRDPNLGKVVLYQLSYSRARQNLTAQWARIYAPATALPARCCARPPALESGGEGDRTPALVKAIHALSQLSYAPAIFAPPRNGPAGTRHLIRAFPRCQAISRTFRPARGITGHT